MDPIIGTLWYDDYNYDGKPAGSHERKTSRVVKVVDTYGEHYVKVKVIGGRNANGNKPGRVTMVKRARLDKSGGYRPFPQGYEIPNHKDDE